MSSPRPILSLQHVHLQYGKFQALRDICFDVMPAERLAIIGPNGSGKSSLFDVISGFNLSAGGEIRLNQQRIERMPAQQRCRAGLVRSFQTSRLFAQMTVLEHVQCAAFYPQSSFWQRYAFWQAMGRMKKVQEKTLSTLQEIGLLSKAHDLAASLTYAEQRLLEIAMVLATDAKVILLDEPTAGLSRAETSMLLERIDPLTQDKTILMIEHDMSVVFGMAHRILVLSHGQVLACDTSQAIRENKQVQQLYLAAGHANIFSPLPDKAQIHTAEETKGNGSKGEIPC